MFEHIRKKLPWRVREERKRKEKFVKRLQEPGHGSPKVRFKNASNIPAGAMILLQDYSDGSMTNAIYAGNDNWLLCGDGSSNSIHSTKTTVEFEDLLTEKRNKATAKAKFLILDQNELLNIDYSAHNNTMGFSKIQWTSIGNDEEED